MAFAVISSKTVVGCLSVLFLAATIGMWAMGGFVIATYKQYNELASAYYVSVPAGVLIFAGIIFLVGAISGLCMVSRDHKCCSITFFATVFFIFILLITAIALSATYRRQINDMVNKEAKTALDEYTESPAMKKQVDYLQETFHCCGSYNFTSWENSNFTKQNPHHVPLSCCKSRNATECLDGDLDRMNKTESNYIYTNGCVGKVETFLDSNLYYLAAGAVAFLVLLILAMIGSCVVLWQRKDELYSNLGS